VSNHGEACYCPSCSSAEISRLNHLLSEREAEIASWKSQVLEQEVRLARIEAISGGRLIAIEEKHHEARQEWLRAERAEQEIARLNEKLNKHNSSSHNCQECADGFSNLRNLLEVKNKALRIIIQACEGRGESELPSTEQAKEALNAGKEKP
jgi:hypothetical protein